MGLNKKTYEQVGSNTEGNSPGSYKEPGLGWMTSFLFLVSFVGILALVPLRKVYIYMLLLLVHSLHFITRKVLPFFFLFMVSHLIGVVLKLIQLLRDMSIALYMYIVSLSYFSSSCESIVY